MNRDLKLKAANGKLMSAMDVFSAAINFLKKQFLNNIKDRDPRKNITVDKVRWVLTVPAIWGFSAKQFMREAAQKVSKDLIFNNCLVEFHSVVL